MFLNTNYLSLTEQSMDTKILFLDLCADNRLEAQIVGQIKHKDNKGIPFPNLCVNFLLEAQTLCANNFFPNILSKKKVLMYVYAIFM